MEIALNNVRLRFENIFFSKSIKGSAPKFSATFLVPEDSPLRAEIDKAILSLATDKWKDKAKANIKVAQGSALTSSWVSGELKDYDGFDGQWSFTATRQEKQGRPTVVNRKGQPITADDNVIYNGCVVNAKVDLYMQDSADFGKGIRASLMGIQFVKDGDVFQGGGGKAAEFAALEDEDEDSLV